MRKRIWGGFRRGARSARPGVAILWLLLGLTRISLAQEGPLPGPSDPSTGSNPTVTSSGEGPVTGADAVAGAASNPILPPASEREPEPASETGLESETAFETEITSESETEPASETELTSESESETASESAAAPATEGSSDAATDEAFSSVLRSITPPVIDDGFEIAGQPIAPGEKRRLEIETSNDFSGVQVATPVVVARGEQPGSVLCLTAGVHGDELIGVEAVRRIAEQVSPSRLRGAIVAIPIANPHGFRRSSRYLPDRRDLNRYFPGLRLGSAASRIAYRIFDGVIRHCDYLVDFHTGSFHRTNTPHVRGDMRNPLVKELARLFGTKVVIHNIGRSGTLRRAAMGAGIPAITFEAGEPMRFEIEGINAGVAGIERLVSALGIVDGPLDRIPDPEFYYSTRWVRVDDGGILLTTALLGQKIEVGDELATVTDPITNHRSVLTSPYSGRIVGMALSQVVIPGFAAFHIAVGGGSLDDAEATSTMDEDLDFDSGPDSRPEE